MAWGFVAGAAISVVGGAIASGNAEDAANNATAAQSASASETAQLGRDQLDFNKQQYNDTKPLRDQTSQANLELMQQQTALAKQQGQISGDYDTYNKETFRPLEKGIVADAEGYDTPERRAAAAAEARASTESAFDTAQSGLARTLARTGNTYGGGRSQSLMQDAALTKAGAIAGATTGATRNVETQGHARMMDAASLGRGLPASQATAAATSTGAGNGATNAGVGAINAASAGLPQVNAGYSGAIGASGMSGQLYGQVGAGARQMTGMYGSALGGFGSAVGSMVPGMMGSMGGGAPMTIDPYGYGAGGSGGSLGYGGGDFSDKKVKSGTGKRINTKKALAGIDKTPVDTGWKYDPAKGGPDDGGQPHDGPMAGDVKKHMGADVSDGHMIDRVSMNGRLLAGMQELSKRVKHLEKRSAP